MESHRENEKKNFTNWVEYSEMSSKIKYKMEIEVLPDVFIQFNFNNLLSSVEFPKLIQFIWIEIKILSICIS